MATWFSFHTTQHGSAVGAHLHHLEKALSRAEKVWTAVWPISTECVVLCRG